MVAGGLASINIESWNPDNEELSEPEAAMPRVKKAVDDGAEPFRFKALGEISTTTPGFASRCRSALTRPIGASCSRTRR